MPKGLGRALEDLNKAQMKIGEAAYKATQTAGAPPTDGAAATATDARAAGGTEPKKGPDDVIDAEYEVK